MKQLSIDCAGCKMARAMLPTTIPRFSGIVRLIGFIIAIPSAMGVVFAVLLFFMATRDSIQAVQTVGADAQAAGAAISYGLSVFMGAGALVGGLVGWLLLMKKKVFKCRNCGYVMDRD